jgi:hypothetical protein
MSKGEGPGNSQAVKKKWQKPEVRVLKAGAAEHLASGKPDGSAGSKS